MNFVALDVAIGLMLVYLLLSLVVLAMNEGLATMIHFRARMMVGGLEILLGGGDRAAGQPHVTALYDMPLIKGLSEARVIPVGPPKKPSYIPAKTFVLSLIDVLAGQARANAPGANEVVPTNAVDDVWALRKTIQLSSLPAGLKAQLITLIIEAGNDIGAARQALGAWFDDGMERVSAAYKARIHVIGIVFAFIATCVFNANTITIARSLLQNPAERTALVSLARQVVAESVAVKQMLPPTSVATDTAAKAVVGTVPADSILRYATAALRQASAGATIIGFAPPPGGHTGWKAMGDYWHQLLVAPLGLLITTFAVSLGAPFWFDTLNKVVNIRGAGRAPEERPKSPEALPPARGA